MKKIILFITFLLIFFSTVGWIDRFLTIKSDPEGADLYFDDKKIGITPFKFDFMWYGKRRVRLEKEGFRVFDATINLRAPYYMFIPIDLASELIPFLTMKDEKEFSYKLIPRESVELPKENNVKQP